MTTKALVTQDVDRYKVLANGYINQRNTEPQRSRCTYTLEEFWSANHPIQA